MPVSKRMLGVGLTLGNIVCQIFVLALAQIFQLGPTIKSSGIEQKCPSVPTLAILFNKADGIVLITTVMLGLSFFINIFLLLLLAVLQCTKRPEKQSKEVILWNLCKLSVILTSGVTFGHCVKSYISLSSAKTKCSIAQTWTDDFILTEIFKTIQNLLVPTFLDVLISLLTLFLVVPKTYNDRIDQDKQIRQNIIHIIDQNASKEGFYRQQQHEQMGKNKRKRHIFGAYLSGTTFIAPSGKLVKIGKYIGPKQPVQSQELSEDFETKVINFVKNLCNQ